MADAGRSRSHKTIPPAAVMTDGHGIVTVWSPEAERLTGHTAGEMVGLPAWEICSRMAPPGHDRDAVRARVKAMVEGIFASGEIPSHPPHSTFRFERGNGEVRTLEHDVATVPAGDGIGLAAFVREVPAESGPASDELDADMHRLLFSQMSSAVAVAEPVFDEDGRPADYRIIEVNPAFEQLTGRPADQWIGKPFSAVRPGLRKELSDLLARVALSGQSEELQSHDAATARYVSIRLSRVGPAWVMAMIEDVTERRRAEAAIRERNAFIETIIASVGEGLIVYDRELRVTVWNPRMEHLTGLSAEEVLGRRGVDAFPEVMAAGIGRDLEQALAGDVPAPREFEYTVPATGRHGWVVQENQPHKGANDEIVGVVSSVVDITAQHEMDEADRRADEQFRMIFDSVGDGLAIHQPGGSFVEVNRVVCERLGYTREEMLAMRVADINAPETIAEIPARTAEILEVGWAAFETVHVRRDGTRVPVEVVAKRIEYRGLPAVLSVHRDITERRRAEAALREQSRFLQAMIDAIPIPIIAKDRDGRTLLCNASFAAAGGFKVGDAIGKTVAELGIPELELHAAHDQAVVADGTIQLYDAFMPTRDKGVRRHLLSKAPLAGEDGSIVGIVTAAVDIHDRYLAELEQKQSEERFRTLFEYAGDAIFINDLEGRFLDANQTACERLGYSKEELIGLSVAAISPPQLGPPVDEPLGTIQQLGSSTFETVHLGRDGTAIPVELIVTMIDLGGRPAVLGIARDITERKRAEAERAALEDQLRQAQKMEGIGQLAGGIAHDFNNLLTAIRGSASLALAALPPGEGPREDMEQIEQAADRAAGLTRQLLAFARRTVLQPEIVDLGDVVTRLEPMLRRVIGEDIALITVVPGSACCVLADPGQLEQVIVNLAVNARDAMPDGGRMTIEIADVPPAGGNRGLATLSVADTGHGIAPETLDHIFEPFFTTKGPGKGTGLGLSTVYGIVRQSGGTVTAKSELGRGAAFTVSLPRVDASPVDGPSQPGSPSMSNARTGTILVVEDDSGVRRFASRVLEAAGYRVLTAPDGNSAVEAAAHGDVQLLLTDVVMPVMSGAEVASRLAATQPGIRVLFMSGHTDKSIVRDGVLEPGIDFLPKPFTSESLLAAVDRAMSRGLGN